MARNATVTIVYNRFPEIIAKMPEAAMEIVEETLVEIDQAVKTGMGSGGGGRTYTHGSVVHTASAPGSMPAVDTGALRASLSHQIIRGEYRGIYFTNMDYAPHLEYGTSKMAARPFMTPAAERARTNFMSKMRNLESRLR